MRHSVSSFAFLAALAVSSTAFAQDITQPKGLYLGGGLFGNIHEDGDVGAVGTARSNVEYDNGFGGALTLGYGYTNNLRSEIELSYGQNDVDTVSGATNPSGDVSKTSGMLNLLYDFPGMGRFTPYIGGGFGATNVALESGATFAGTRVTTDDDEWTWAAQGIAGVGYQLTENLGMFADYRYFMTGDTEFRTSQNVNVESDFTEHRIMVGLRWFFGAPKPMPMAAAAPAPMAAPPAPPPAPVAAPAPARNYIVFFDFDKADLKTDAQTVVRQAAAGFKNSQGVTRIEATGHADRSGTPAYNQKISQRRAEAVRAELVAQGVPANAITISARGETQPLVQTADGVREPQNRRVEIVLR
jgi:outer membrane protein OmpA-like peptidoglycan-associated protein/outer membrane protein W